ncbi:hypothetical protein, partial [Prevotella sp. TCVGH]|uniref:hypothetical protein n=1 Tax=Prevotella sp. TCVGH TaxID=2182433 RepID=UPI00201DC704
SFLPLQAYEIMCMRGGVQLGFTTDPIFVYGLPIDFFYFEDFDWSFFVKIIFCVLIKGLIYVN